MAKSKISRYVDLAGESVSNFGEVAKERIDQIPLRIILDKIILFKENNYQYVRITAKGYYFGRMLNEKDALDARCFVIGRINPISGEVDYSYGAAKTPESMGYIGFDYDGKTGFWTIDFGPWPEEFPLQGQDIIVRLNAKGHSTATRGKVE